MARWCSCWTIVDCTAFSTRSLQPEWFCCIRWNISIKFSLHFIPKFIDHLIIFWESSDEWQNMFSSILWEENEINAWRVLHSWMFYRICIATLLMVLGIIYIDKQQLRKIISPCNFVVTAKIIILFSLLCLSFFPHFYWTILSATIS